MEYVVDNSKKRFHRYSIYLRINGGIAIVVHDSPDSFRLVMLWIQLIQRILCFYSNFIMIWMKKVNSI